VRRRVSPEGSCHAPAGNAGERDTLGQRRAPLRTEPDVSGLPCGDGSTGARGVFTVPFHPGELKT
jgi:hypothetical protein